MTAFKVLRVNEAEETEAYRAAVSDIIRKLIAHHDQTLVSIAETIDVSVGTISNAFNKKGDLNGIYLNRLGLAYGPHTLDPYYALSGGRSVPLNPEEVDPLPAMLRAGFELAKIREANSEGGVGETHREQANVLPFLEGAQRDVTAKIVSIKARLAS